MAPPALKLTPQAVVSWSTKWNTKIDSVFKFPPPLFQVKLRLLRVLVVLMTDDKGGRPMGEVVKGSAVPADPWLRDASRHPPGKSFIDDWISLANAQLWHSGATFMLDSQNVRYVLEHNTKVNCMDGEEGDEALAKLLALRRKPAIDNPWRNSVILLCRWGAPGQVIPDWGAFSGPFNDCVVLGRYLRSDDDPVMIDGKGVPGNNLLSHEFGHFMGLAHTFPDRLALDIAAKSFVDNLDVNPGGYPLAKAHLAEFNGLTEADLASARAEVSKLIATWRFGLDQDAGLDDNEPVAEEFRVFDTPKDLGMGLPAAMGDPIGTGVRTYNLERWNDLIPLTTEKVVPPYGSPNTSKGKSTEPLKLNDAVRLNVMSYWNSDIYGQRYSPGQVATMTHWLDTFRAPLVGRTITVGKIPAPVPGISHPVLDRLIPRPQPIDPSRVMVGQPRFSPVQARAQVRAVLAASPRELRALTLPASHRGCIVGRRASV